MSPVNLCKTLDLIGTKEAYAEKMVVLRKSVRDNNIQAYGLMGRAYRDGKGVPSDLHIAAMWMSKATEKKIGWAYNELFDILWDIGTPDSYDQMVAVITSRANNGDGGAMGRLGRAYCDGKGVPKDLDKAVEWMSKAAEKNVGWAKNELPVLIDMLNSQ